MKRNQNEDPKEIFYVYDDLINNTIGNQIKYIQETRECEEKILSQINELQKTLKTIQENQLTEMKTMVDLGCKFFVKAKIPSTKYIHVKVGLNFYAQLTIEEAVKYAERREKDLKTSIESLNKRSKALQESQESFFHTANNLLQKQTNFK